MWREKSESITMTQSTEYRADMELESGHNMGGFMSIQVGASQSSLAQPYITQHLYFKHLHYIVPAIEI